MHIDVSYITFNTIKMVIRYSHLCFFISTNFFIFFKTVMRSKLSDCPPYINFVEGKRNNALCSHICLSVHSMSSSKLSVISYSIISELLIIDKYLCFSVSFAFLKVNQGYFIPPFDFLSISFPKYNLFSFSVSSLWNDRLSFWMFILHILSSPFFLSCLAEMICRFLLIYLWWQNLHISSKYIVYNLQF